MNEQFFSFKTLHLGARPARVTVLVNSDDADWQDTLLRIIEWLSNCWGGRYDLIVPSDGHAIDEDFWWLMERYDPDYIYSYSKTMLDLKISKPEDYESWIEKHIEQFMRTNPDAEEKSIRNYLEAQSSRIAVQGVNITEKLTNEIHKRINPFKEIIHSINAASIPSYPLTALGIAFASLDNPQEILSPTFETSKDFQLYLHSIAGKLNEQLRYSENDLVGESKKTISSVSYVSWKETHIHEFIQTVLREGDDFTTMPFPKTMVGMSFWSRSIGFREHPVIIFGNTLKDFCVYYNLSRMKPNVYWLSSDILNAYINETSKKGSVVFEGKASYLYWLREMLEEVLRTKTEQIFYVYSTSSNQQQLRTLRKTLDSATVVSPKEPISNKMIIMHSIADLIGDVRRVYEEDVPFRSYVEQFYKGESISLLNTPIPRQFTAILPSHNWITDVFVDGYMLPQVQKLGPRSVVQKNYDNEQVRISLEGFSYFCPNIGFFYAMGGIENIVIRPKLKLFDDFAIIEDLFREAGYLVKHSDKGNFHREVCSRLSGFDKLSDFMMDEKKRRLLIKYLDIRDSEEGEGVFIKGEGRYLWFPEIKKILGSDARDILDSLLEHKIIYRGFIFKCAKCRNASWYSIEDVTSSFVCSRCRTEQIYKREHWRQYAEPRWYYKLDELFYQAIKNNIYVPVLAIHKLNKMALRGFHYTPELEVRKDARSKEPDLELDFVVIIDGKIHLGEATTENKLASTARKERARLSKLRDIVAAVNARKIVLATFSEEWSEGTKRNVEEIFEESACLPLYFARKELLS